MHYSVAKNRPSKPLKKAKLKLVRFSSSACDFDGLVSSFKHVIDGLRYSGIIADDKLINIGQPEYDWKKTKPKQGKIWVKVTEVLR